MQNNLSIKIEKTQATELFNNLISKGYLSDTPNNEYVVWRVQNENNTLLFYKSGSLVFQGKDNPEKVLNEFKIKSPNSEVFAPHMGSDEVGKGDFFGPLVVCCAYLDTNSLNKIRGFGISDSKKLSDTKILEIYEKIKDTILFEVVIQTPELYNRRLADFKNVSYFLASLHRDCAERLFQKLKSKNLKPEYIVIDQFSLNKSRLGNEFNNMGLRLLQFHKGESDIAVATASVIARATFLLEWKKMEEKFNFTFPKGATSVIESGKSFVEKYGLDELRNVAKVSFKTTTQVTSFS